VKHVLIVDDDGLLLSLLDRALAGFQVTTAQNGEEALHVFQPGVRIDLLITDYLMPSMLGDELLGRVRERRPSLKALVITGYGETLAREAPDWWTRQEHLQKPFTMKALRETVIRLIGAPDSE
jgi:DNA-binding NtrC family response regulator